MCGVASADVHHTAKFRAVFVYIALSYLLTQKFDSICDFVTISAVENGNLFSEGESESRLFLLSSYKIKDSTYQLRVIPFVI